MVKARFVLAAVLLGVWAGRCGFAESAVTPLTNVHAHNDYEHTRPLFDALDNGFCSVEADIYLVDGALQVGHTRKELKPERTLESLYLDPLKARIAQNGGHVYPNGPDFYLLIDVKTEPVSTYQALHEVLAKYADMFTSYTKGKMERRAVTAIVTGNRQVDVMKSQAVRYAALDGRVKDLDGPVDSTFMPLISENWRSQFKWVGDGPMPADERAKLDAIVKKAHAAGCRLRFWNTPEREDFWKLELEAGVDVLNADDLPRVRKFLLANPK